MGETDRCVTKLPSGHRCGHGLPCPAHSGCGPIADAVERALSRARSAKDQLLELTDEMKRLGEAIEDGPATGYLRAADKIFVEADGALLDQLDKLMTVVSLLDAERERLAEERAKRG